MKKLIPVGFAVVATVLTSLWLFSASRADEDKSGPNVYELLDLFSEAMQIVRTKYVEEIDDVELIQGAVQGMLATLDPHSAYMTPDQMNTTEEQTSGQFGGLGIEVTMEKGWVKVVSPIDDTPAARAGIEAGDYIIEIDGETVLGMMLDEAVKKMRGPVGSEIVLTVEREGESAPLEIVIERDIIRIASAEVRREASTIVVRVKTFNRQSLTNVVEGITEQLEEAGGVDNITGVILDLRNNPGGLLDTAIEISDAFLERGDIVSVRGRDVAGTQNYSATPGDLAAGKPIVVLINRGSASASEIVAGALQDHKRAIVVGTRSFGKGSVQTIINLGSEKGGVRLTTARYYTPSGRSIQAQGIVPDIHFEEQRSSSVAAEDERDYLSEADLPGRLENDSLMNAEDDDEARQIEQEELQQLRLEDPQMAYAIDILSAIDAFELR
ncbi:MAG: S41 family peptidase [Rhodobacteraceae bacterium]|nr:S41 family peptidase [Paracoccaceae bacterium]MCY4196408.1 S41 family peptidase [Paracoccaceae bacterium]